MARPYKSGFTLRILLDFAQEKGPREEEHENCIN